MPRNTDLTPEIQSEVVKILATGATIADTCAYVGITERTYYNWMKKGRTERKDNEVYVQFFQAATRARSSARVSALVVIRKAIQDGDTNSAQWYLERSDPENWGRRTYAKIEGLDDLLALAKAKGLNASELFNAMIAELSSADAEK